MVSTAACRVTPDTGVCACAVTGHAEPGPKLGTVADLQNLKTVGGSLLLHDSLWTCDRSVNETAVRIKAAVWSFNKKVVFVRSLNDTAPRSVLLPLCLLSP